MNMTKQSAFSSIEKRGEDPILGIVKAFRDDNREKKVCFGVGAFRTVEDQPFVLSPVRKAEARLIEKGLNKEYLPIEGLEEFTSGLKEVVFGQDSAALKEGRIASCQTVGGGGALRAIGELIKNFVTDRIYISSPTWVNHPEIFKQCGFQVGTYPYWNSEKRELDFDAMIDAIEKMPERSAIVLHACCHNPTGVDPSLEQWKAISDAIKKRHLIPFFDIAYQGFDQGLEEDAAALRLFVEEGHELFVATSCSKNFGLYGERVGMASVVAKSRSEAESVRSHMKYFIRTGYSMAPLHGARIVAMILGTQSLKTEWKQELNNMRERIIEMRRALVSELHAKSHSDLDFSFILKQKGMFSYTGLTKEQVDLLCEKHAVFMPRSGRLNVASLNPNNIQHFVNALLDVTSQ